VLSIWVWRKGYTDIRSLLRFNGGLRLQIKEELERKFGEAAMRRFGYGKGSLSHAAEEGI
jgi:hypothetical protein